MAARSLGVVMVVLAAFAVAPLGGNRTVGVPAYLVAGALIIGGGSLFVRRPAVFYIALAAALTLVGAGLAGLLLHRAASLPIPPSATIAIGLYLCLRVTMVKPFLARKKPRMSLSSDE